MFYKRLFLFLIMCMAVGTVKTQPFSDGEIKARKYVKGFYARLQQGVRNGEDFITIEADMSKYVGLSSIKDDKTPYNNIDMPSDLSNIDPVKFKYNDTGTRLSNYIGRLCTMRLSDGNCVFSYNVLSSIHRTQNYVYVLVSKTILYKGTTYEFIDWVHVKHREGPDIDDNNTSITKITETASILIVGNDGEPLTSAMVDSRRSKDLIAKLPNSCGVYIIGMDDSSRTITISDPYYSDIVDTTIKRGETIKIQLKNKKAFLDQYEKAKFRLYIPFAYPLGDFGKGSDNWMEGGNAWSNYPFDLAYFFEDNRVLTKAAMSMGFGLGTKAIIPLKKSTTAIMVQAEYLLLLSNSGKISSGQAMPAEVFYYQYNPSSGLNNVKVLETNMNFSFPRLNTMDVMLGVNKKFRNIIGSSHLELEGAIGAAWHWSSDFKGQSTTSGEYNFVANYDIFSGTPSLAFEVGVAMTIGSHLSLGLNYVYLGGFDVKGHANWNSTVVQNSDANVNNVDFDFGHVTVHYLGLVLSYSVQHK